MWTLRRKILAGYAIAMLLAGVVLGAALLNIVRLGNASDDILQENYRSILAAEEMLNALSRQENAAMQMVVSVEPENVKAFGEAEQRFLLWLERAKANITIDGEAEILDRIENGYRQFMFLLAKFRNVYQGDRAKGAAFYRKELQPQAAAIRKACDDLHELNRRTMEAASAQAQGIARAAVWSMIGVGILVLGGALTAGVWLSNRIVRPVRSLSEATERVATGDYDVTIAPESADEIGQLAQKFSLMVTKLRAFHELNLRRIIGEQKKAEVILQTIDDGVLVVGADRKVMSLNPTAANVLAVHAHGVEGRDFSEVVNDDALARVLTDAFKSKSVPEREAGQNIIAVHGQEGQDSFFEYTLTSISPRDGELIGFVVLFRNVTALKELDRLKTEFVMTASHELRSPLTSIAMSIELLREQAADKLDESGRQMLDVAHEELARLRQLVDELLDLSKIQSGKLEMELAPVSVSDLLQGAVAPFDSQAREQSLELACTVPEGLPPVHADPNKMTWVVTNLVGNALRYARSRIDVSAEKAGPWVQIAVRDDGPGISPKDQARIFEKFVQIKDGGQPGGAGLGLAISREIVKAHHGNIWVDSEPGKGTRFTVALPAAKELRVEG